MMIRAITVSTWLWLSFAYVLGGQVFAAMAAIVVTGFSLIVWIVETEL